MMIGVVVVFGEGYCFVVVMFMEFVVFVGEVQVQVVQVGVGDFQLLVVGYCFVFWQVEVQLLGVVVEVDVGVVGGGDEVVGLFCLFEVFYCQVVIGVFEQVQ